MRSVAIGIIGPGVIGGALVSQLMTQKRALQEILQAAIQIVGVANSTHMLTDLNQLEACQSDLKQELARLGKPTDLDAFGRMITESRSPCCILVDCTASDTVAAAYIPWMNRGLHIVTPNKKFPAGPFRNFADLQTLCLQTGRLFMFEATVGAGLPIVSTLKSLTETGDEILSIEGVLSGTLSYIFNTYKPGMKFSDVVISAKAQGYTEPDPREDLSGMDVARKVVILARLCGLQVELSDLQVNSLVHPEHEALGSVEEYMQRLPEGDAEMGALAEVAEREQSVMRYVGKVDVVNRQCSVSVARYSRSHPLAQLSGTENIVVITTKRYKQYPLVVKGPGAGPDVTAAGIFSDIIQVIRCSNVQGADTPAEQGAA